MEGVEVIVAESASSLFENFLEHRFCGVEIALFQETHRQFVLRLERLGVEVAQQLLLLHVPVPEISDSPIEFTEFL
jgi:hypothetical protein